MVCFVIKKNMAYIIPMAIVRKYHPIPWNEWHLKQKRVS